MFELIWNDPCQATDVCSCGTSWAVVGMTFTLSESSIVDPGASVSVEFSVGRPANARSRAVAE